jgi:hypothetical protein
MRTRHSQTARLAQLPKRRADLQDARMTSNQTRAVMGGKAVTVGEDAAVAVMLAGAGIQTSTMQAVGGVARLASQTRVQTG